MTLKCDCLTVQFDGFTMCYYYLLVVTDNGKSVLINVLENDRK